MQASLKYDKHESARSFVEPFSRHSVWINTSPGTTAVLWSTPYVVALQYVNSRTLILICHLVSRWTCHLPFYVLDSDIQINFALHLNLNSCYLHRIIQQFHRVISAQLCMLWQSWLGAFRSCFFSSVMYKLASMFSLMKIQSVFTRLAYFNITL